MPHGSRIRSPRSRDAHPIQMWGLQGSIRESFSKRSDLLERN
ncbi:MAG TPA: hypothetical protein VKM93_06830 [Terriglobia bacterium]|nr:hypothetical protein [Terriglobia bacterium]